jgi:hypothetical protein
MSYLRKAIPVLLVLILLVPVYSVQAADNTNWKKLYIDYINKNPGSEPVLSSYSLIYINDDDVPELWIDYGVGYEGCVLCTVSGGKLEVIQFASCGMSYIKRQNLFVISTGRMDSYYDYVYRIKNGEFVKLHEGEYGAEDNANVQYDANDEPIYQYCWEGKEVSKKQYERALKSVFDDTKAVSPNENSYSASEIVSKIRGF